MLRITPQSRIETNRANPDLDDWRVVDFVDLRNGCEPDRGKHVIEGLARDGEVGLLVSSSKVGKSWMAGQLAWCVVSGTPFLGMSVLQGKVLIIDNELKPREIDFRHTQISKAMKHLPKSGEVAVLCRRGKSCDVMLIASHLKEMVLTGYSLIIVDALYKIIPNGRSENDNEAMGKLMNVLQGIADETCISIVVVAHTSKGDQSAKSRLDLVSGAGAFGRSLDFQIAIRPHSDDTLSVAQFVRRTGEEPEPISIKFEWPLWVVSTAAPALRVAKANKLQAAKDAEADAKVSMVLTKKPKGTYEIRKLAGMGEARVVRSLGRLVATGKALKKKFRSPKTSQFIDGWIGTTIGSELSSN